MNHPLSQFKTVTPAEMDALMASGKCEIKLVIVNNRWYSAYEVQESHKTGRTIITVQKG